MVGTNLKSALTLVLKGSVSLGSLTYIALIVDWATIGYTLMQAKVLWLLMAYLIFLAAQGVSSLRCVYIARTLGGNLDFSTSLRAHFVGLWFNQVLPTSLGGDVLKVFLLKRTLGLGMAVRSALLDRLSGFAFVLVAIALTLPLYATLIGQVPGMFAGLGLLSVGGVLVIALSAWGGHHLKQFVPSRWRIGNLIQVLSDVWLFRAGSAIWEQIWTSAIVHFNGIAAYALLGLAFGVDINLLEFVLLVPLVFLIALFPVSFAGWGLREAGAVWLFAMVGVSKENALAMSIGFGLLLIAAGLPGIVLFFKDKRVNHHHADK
jgi:uncharacterized membrane protein YbhN (UPF0104 family)